MTIVHTFTNIAEEYYQYVKERSALDSNKPSSYVRAIHILNDVLNKKCPEILGTTRNLWIMTDVGRLEAIRQVVLAEVKKPLGGIFAGIEPQSYWKNNYCSAALAALVSFQQLNIRKQDMLYVVERSGNPEELAAELEEFPLQIDVEKRDEMGVTLDDLSGKDRLVIQKARENQYKFRALVLWNYRNQCCISGLPIVHSLQASHIVSWCDDVALRLNATNGLCLAAHYHLAFDNHLIALDEHYRLVISKTLKEYVTNEAFSEQFQKYEGRCIRLPQKFMPSKKLLENHREQLAI